MSISKKLGFFFSSRRRHTRWTGDWSSDVCSSDLVEQYLLGVGVGAGAGDLVLGSPHFDVVAGQIGRASCRERELRTGRSVPLIKLTDKAFTITNDNVDVGLITQTVAVPALTEGIN